MRRTLAEREAFAASARHQARGNLTPAHRMHWEALHAADPDWRFEQDATARTKNGGAWPERFDLHHVTAPHSR